MVELLDDVPERALCVFAHPDDPDVSCGGTMARWASAGCELSVVVCTPGDKGTTDSSLTPDVVRALRAEEMAQAGRTLGTARRETLDVPDGELENSSDLRRTLVRLVRSLRPEVVICPDPTAVFFGQEYYNHRDHRATGWAVLDAVSPAAGLPLYFPGEGPVHQVGTVLLSGTLEPDAWVDITASMETKCEAVACHRSQFADGPGWAEAAVRLGAETEGRRAGVAYAEAFRKVRLGG